MEPTEEEILAFLEQYAAQQQLMGRAQNDPLALSANAYGQGPGFLGLEDRPDSWSRLGDKNQIYRDMFQMTGTDMSEYVPGLYDYVPQPKPEDVMGYQSDTTSLFANNPVYQEIERQVANGVDIVTATNAVRTAYEQNPEALAGSLPMGNPEYGQAEPDWEAVNRNATTYLSERNKEVAGQSEADMLRAQYEDYVAPRTAYDKSAETQDLSWEANRDATMRMMGYDPNEQTSTPNPYPSFDTIPMGTRQVAPTAGPGLAQRVDNVGNDIEDFVSSVTGRNTTGRIGNLGGQQGPSVPQRQPQLMNEVRKMSAKPDPKVVRAKQKEDNARSSWDAAARIAKTKNVGSKKEENLAKLTAFYNTLMYGQ